MLNWPWYIKVATKMLAPPTARFNRIPSISPPLPGLMGPGLLWLTALRSVVGGGLPPALSNLEGSFYPQYNHVEFGAVFPGKSGWISTAHPAERSFTVGSSFLFKVNYQNISAFTAYHSSHYSCSISLACYFFNKPF